MALVIQAALRISRNGIRALESRTRESRRIWIVLQWGDLSHAPFCANFHNICRVHCLAASNDKRALQMADAETRQSRLADDQILAKPMAYAAFALGPSLLVHRSWSITLGLALALSGGMMTFVRPVLPAAFPREVGFDVVRAD
jgi:hypothetical protein